MFLSLSMDGGLHVRDANNAFHERMECKFLQNVTVYGVPTWEKGSPFLYILRDIHIF